MDNCEGAIWLYPWRVLRDPHAPMVTVSVEEPALAPARTLVRVPQSMCSVVARKLSSAIEPASAQAHADLATYLTVLVELFGPRAVWRF